MQKLLFFFMILPILLCSQVGTLPDIFSEATMVKAYNDGKEIVMESESQTKLDQLFSQAVKGAEPVPAFAVAIHELTVEDMQSGIWLKFTYKEKRTVNNMPFDELLIHVVKDGSGVNVIRGNNGMYNGRCFYLNLKGNMNEIYDLLLNLETKEIVEESHVEIELESQEIEEVNVKSENEDEDEDDTSAKLKEVNNLPNINEDKEDNNKVIEIKPEESAENVLVETLSKYEE